MGESFLNVTRVGMLLKIIETFVNGFNIFILIQIEDLLRKFVLGIIALYQLKTVEDVIDVLVLLKISEPLLKVAVVCALLKVFNTCPENVNIVASLNLGEAFLNVYIGGVLLHFLELTSQLVVLPLRSFELSLDIIPQVANL